MSATPLYIKGGHTNMAAVNFNYACQMRYPVNYNFQISVYVTVGNFTRIL